MAPIVNKKRIIVVGAGPAGMMAALAARMNHADVVLAEKNASPGRKLLLTGNGRCNFTNTCDINLYEEHFFHGGKFLRDAFRQFSNQDTIHFFKKNGIRYKIEENNCVFPVTNSAESILDVFKKELKQKKVTVLYNTVISGLIIKLRRLNPVFTERNPVPVSLSCGIKNEIEGVRLANNEVLPCRCVILATGGISYPCTGSNGEGLRIASKAGHTIVALRPGLAWLEASQSYIQSLEGLTVENVALTFCGDKKKRRSKKVSLLFTQQGISGPAVLSHSNEVAQWLSKIEKVQVIIDFFPDITKEELTAKMIREWLAHPKKSIKNTLSGIVPHRLAEVLIKVAGLDGSKTVSYITRIERKSIVDFLKEMRLDVTKTGPIEKAMITQGGISLKQVYPQTMESQIVRGLYFAGEMLDIDGDTGGFNLQAAFSTGYCAGKHAAMRV